MTTKKKKKKSEKDISTLVEDINHVLQTKEGWEIVNTVAIKEGMGQLFKDRFETKRVSKPTLRMSNMGTPCLKKLAYSIHNPELEGTLPAQTHMNFLYGDLLEVVILELAKAAGHTVEGEQDEMSIDGIKGHRDAVIDGVTVDVKSASKYSFDKFKNGKLRDDDPFGYISQLSSYVHCGADDPIVTNKTQGAFLVVNKLTGEICLDMYTFDKELAEKKAVFSAIKNYVASTKPEDMPRKYEDEESKTNGNRQLGIFCSYCSFKKQCWPGLRKFVDARGWPTYFTEVNKTPRTREIEDF